MFNDTFSLLFMYGAVLLGGIVGLYFVLKQWAESAYPKMVESNPNVDMDAFCVDSPPSKLKVALAHTLRMGKRQPSLTPIPLECTQSEHVKGLFVSRNVMQDGKEVTPLQDLLPRVGEDGRLDKKNPTVVVATIRMGFGHHRLAYSACSWALEQGYTTIFHDLLNIQSDESALIHSVDALYSKFSRLATEWGGPVEKLWGQAMKQGDADGLRIASLTAAHLQPLLLAYPKDIPLIATHQLVALTAAAVGFTNVINLVVDNYPQWFLVVPKTLNVTQGPVNYESFLKMGVQPNEVRLAGHWCPLDLVKNIDLDCKRRIERATSSPLKPRRLLIPVGGAGAQKTFIVKFIQAIQNLVKQGKLELFLNAGDHTHMKTAFMDVLSRCGLDYNIITTTQQVYDFQADLLKGANPPKAVTLFAFEEYFPAVATTDILCRVADVLTCKPSELAFYALPKLHIRRVGDHEADSARRAAEAGDGTLEAREIQDAMTYLNLFLKTPDLLVSMNEQVMKNNQIGMYDGCKNCVKWAVE